MKKYTVIDIETTGLYVDKGAEITEIAGANIVDGEVLTTFSSTVKINGEVSEFIRNLTGITQEMCNNSQCFAGVFIDFIDCLCINKDTNIIIHNVEFDFNFILVHATRNFIPKEYIEKFKNAKFICSLELARKLLPGESHKLDYLKKKFNISTTSHRALNDVLVTNRVYKKLLELEAK